MGLGSWPARRARMSPERTAMVYSGQSTTYAELAARVTRLAWQLRKAGVDPGDRVAYLGPNHPAFVETMFATHVLGGVFVPLNFRLTESEVDHMLTGSGAKLLVSDREFSCPTIPLDDYEDWVAAGSPEPIDEPVALDDLALILYTSGTTGRPKGAMLSHANLLWNTVNLLAGVDVASDEVALVSAPLFHVAALTQTLLPTVLKGGTAVLTASWYVETCFDLIAEHRITWMFGVTTMYAALAHSPRWATADLTSLRRLLCGGAAVPESLIREYQDRGLVFCQGYGLTETAPGATFLEAADSVRKAGSAGVPVFFGDIRIIRADGGEAAPGEPGEVLVQGPNVTPGYWHDPQATASALADGWFHTGDVAKLDDEGHLYIVDRLKDMFISGGENVYPAEVEKAAAGHPSVEEVAVVGVPDEKWGEVGRAFVRCRPGATLTRDELRSYLLGRLAKYKIPVHVDVVDQLPRTGSGKVLKSALRHR
ncbi:long-chain fatty acid--CoA ligase [Amycolatopsis sp. NPDC059657]|uniref:acyl-CoA synthetase n=1 Tax=Amycolatopsis sp. NPDC059657 TaxID=3346899 RepID=UPI003671A7F3